MKTNYFKAGACLIIALFAIHNTKAQTIDSNKNVSTVNRYFNYDRVTNEQGKRVETIEAEWGDKRYKATLVNGKMAELYVNGEKILAANWAKYKDLTDAINEQIAKNREQEKKNREQSRLNEIQSKKNEEQSRLNRIQAQKNEEQVARNREQERLNEIQAKRNKEQAVHNQAQEERNKEQAVRNQEQERLNAIQAQKNEEQAAANEKFIKGITADLIADKIIPDANSLKELTFNGDEMIVNGVKQSAEIHQKYIKKYNGFVKGSFNFSRDGVINGN